MDSSFEDVIPTTEPFVSEPLTTQTSQPPLKKKRRDPRQGVFIPEQSQGHLTQPTTTPTTTFAVDSSVPSHEGPSTIFEVGGSSALPRSAPPRPFHVAASVRLAMYLAQQQSSVPSSYAKRVSIEESHPGEDDSTMHELRKEIGVLNQKNIELDIRVADLEAEKAQLNIRVADLEADKTLKSKQISDLQTHLGTITACYFDLKKTLAEKFGDKFKSSVQEFNVGQSSQSPC
ncbi:uncharacterized protein LOC111895576 [Lactuca sativa]|uniref:uncharacterized protein LOC111895576 n=1 Tax=Lactuca sativa TaxID=4236 RepID=UPI001C68AF5F|nr:uncharacterized protein LOC111895576 [Lactuca sativa]XP_042754982.1 uncharacterized protein LOC111895576 [Lactuca sativa]XP_042754984.1 uncharacterized protein LOC111895576 [Lactuca sativa]XP_042754985.1 uncharacterized protein LOC111895576 [Lactuca sativa]